MYLVNDQLQRLRVADGALREAGLDATLLGQKAVRLRRDVV